MRSPVASTGRGASSRRIEISSVRRSRSRQASRISPRSTSAARRSTSSSEASTPRSAPMSVSSRLSRASASRTGRPETAASTRSMSSVWVILRPRLSFFQKPLSGSGASPLSGSICRRSISLIGWKLAVRGPLEGGSTLEQDSRRHNRSRCARRWDQATVSASTDCGPRGSSCSVGGACCWTRISPAS